MKDRVGVECPDAKLQAPFERWWIATHGDSTCHVWTMNWATARDIASAELGAPADPVPEQ